MKDRTPLRHLTIGQTLSIERSGGLVGVLALHNGMLNSGISSRLVFTEDHRGSAEPPEAVRLQAVLGNRFYFGWRSGERIARAIQYADVVHVHGLYTYLNYVAGRSCRRFGKALIYHPHGSLVPAYLNSGHIKKEIVLSAFERRNFRHLAGWRALTMAEADQIRAFVPGAKVFVVPNGITLPSDTTTVSDCSSRLSLTADPSKRIFLSLSRVRASKGLDVLLDAWTCAAARMRGCELWIAGPDFDGTGQMLRKRIRERKVEGVRMLGTVSEADKRWLLRTADVFVLPSRGEGQSATVLEAMAHGRPVLLTNTCYFPQAATAGAGFECNLGVANIVELLLTFAEMPDSALRDMGHRARAVISDQFDIRHVARDLDRRTREILEW